MSGSCLSNTDLEMTEDQYDAHQLKIQGIIDKLPEVKITDWRLTDEEANILDALPDEVFIQIGAELDRYTPATSLDVRSDLVLKGVATFLLDWTKTFKQSADIGWNMGSQTV